MKVEHQREGRNRPTLGVVVMVLTSNGAVLSGIECFKSVDMCLFAENVFNDAG